MATILIGMGNPVLTDDSVGLKIAQRVAKLLAGSCGVAVRELYSGGINLMEALAGYDRALIVDAMYTPDAKPGTICSPTVNELFQTHNTCSTHDGNLGVALELGKLAGLHLPSEIPYLGHRSRRCNVFWRTAHARGGTGGADRGGAGDV